MMQQDDELKLYYEDLSNIPAGHICKCGRKCQWSSYVYAHTRDPIVFTCPDCGTKAIILNHEITDLKN